MGFIDLRSRRSLRSAERELAVALSLPIDTRCDAAVAFPIGPPTAAEARRGEPLKCASSLAFNAEVGLGVRSTPFDSSFCAKAILENGFLMVPDATKDKRFECNPLVTGEPNLRFYAGALLKMDNDLAIRTVCVLGYEPMALDELQQDMLKLLA